MAPERTGNVSMEVIGPLLVAASIIAVGAGE